MDFRAVMGQAMIWIVGMAPEKLLAYVARMLTQMQFAIVEKRRGVNATASSKPTPPGSCNICKRNEPGLEEHMAVRGVMPFLTWDIIRIGILLMFPGISLIALKVFG